eukprot:jgi/Bigna1/85430/estExt_fgenesh1_pg.C_40069
MAAPKGDAEKADGCGSGAEGGGVVTANNALKSLVTSIRNIRAVYKLDSKQKLNATTIYVAAQGACCSPSDGSSSAVVTTLLEALESQAAVIAALCTIDPKGLRFLNTTASSSSSSSSSSSIKVVGEVVQGGLEFEIHLHTRSLVGLARDQERLGRKRANLEALIAALEVKLSNTEFSHKAHPNQTWYCNGCCLRQSKLPRRWRSSFVCISGRLYTK